MESTIRSTNKRVTTAAANTPSLSMPTSTSKATYMDVVDRSLHRAMTSSSHVPYQKNNTKEEVATRIADVVLPGYHQHQPQHQHNNINTRKDVDVNIEKPLVLNIYDSDDLSIAIEKLAMKLKNTTTTTISNTESFDKQKTTHQKEVVMSQQISSHHTRKIKNYSFSYTSDYRIGNESIHRFSTNQCSQQMKEIDNIERTTLDNKSSSIHFRDISCHNPYESSITGSVVVVRNSSSTTHTRRVTADEDIRIQGGGCRSLSPPPPSKSTILTSCQELIIGSRINENDTENDNDDNDDDDDSIDIITDMLSRYCNKGKVTMKQQQQQQQYYNHDDDSLVQKPWLSDKQKKDAAEVVNNNTNDISMDESIMMNSFSTTTKCHHDDSIDHTWHDSFLTRNRYSMVEDDDDDMICDNHLTNDIHWQPIGCTNTKSLSYCLQIKEEVEELDDDHEIDEYNEQSIDRHSRSDSYLSYYHNNNSHSNNNNNNNNNNTTSILTIDFVSDESTTKDDDQIESESKNNNNIGIKSKSKKMEPSDKNNNNKEEVATTITTTQMLQSSDYDDENDKKHITTTTIMGRINNTAKKESPTYLHNNQYINTQHEFLNQNCEYLNYISTPVVQKNDNIITKPKQQHNEPIISSTVSTTSSSYISDGIPEYIFIDWGKTYEGLGLSDVPSSLLKSSVERPKTIHSQHNSSKYHHHQKTMTKKQTSNHHNGTVVENKEKMATAPMTPTTTATSSTTSKIGLSQLDGKCHIVDKTSSPSNHNHVGKQWNDRNSNNNNNKITDTFHSIHNRGGVLIKSISALWNVQQPPPPSKQVSTKVGTKNHKLMNHSPLRLFQHQKQQETCCPSPKKPLKDPTRMLHVKPAPTTTTTNLKYNKDAIILKNEKIKQQQQQHEIKVDPSFSRILVDL